MELHLECDQPHYDERGQAKLAGRTDKQMDRQTQSGRTDRGINTQIKKQNYTLVIPVRD